MTSFAPSTSTGGSPYVSSSPLKTSSMSPYSTVDSNAEDAETEQGHPSRITCTLQLFNPIADTKEIVYDSSKAREGHNDQDSSAPENATCVGGSITSSCAGRDANVNPSDESTFDDGKRANVSLLSLTLRAFGGCLLRPSRQGNKSVKAVAPRKGLRLLPKRRSTRRRIQLFKSRSSSSDGSDPTTTTTSINGEQNRLLSDGSGDSADRSTQPATHNTNEILEGSVSEVCDVSFYDNEDDKTLGDVSYAFSQAAGISVEEPRVYDDIGIGSTWDEIGISRSTDSEGRVMLQADTVVGTDGGDAISLMFDDEDETDGDLFALSDANEDGENDESNDDNDGGDRFKSDSSEVATMFGNIIPDELEYIQPLFTHKSLRQASEKQTSYDFVTNDEENDDDGVCAAMESTFLFTGNV